MICSGEEGLVRCPGMPHGSMFNLHIPALQESSHRRGLTKIQKEGKKNKEGINPTFAVGYGRITSGKR